jgi:hypothetical protein
MFQNKKTPSETVQPFQSKPNNPQVLQKRFQKHVAQKLVVRVGYNDISPDGSLIFNVTSKLLEELPDECMVSLESFNFLGPGTLNATLTALNIESPYFTNGRQYIAGWSGGNGEYSPIIATVPVNYSYININNTGVAYTAPVLNDAIGCFNTNKNILNNYNIPFQITTQSGAVYKVPTPFDGNFSIQFTLVFYGLNDDERYSMIPINIPK